MLNLRKVASYDSKLHKFADYFHEDDVVPFTMFLVSVAAGFALMLGLTIGLIAGSYVLPNEPQKVVVEQKAKQPPRFKEVSRDLVVGETTYIVVAKDTYTNECYAFTQYRFGGSSMAYSDLITVPFKK
jgi:hypothetical protein